MATSIKAIIAGATRYAYHGYGYGENQVILVLKGKLGTVQWDMESMSLDNTPDLDAWREVTNEVLMGNLGHDIARICAMS